MTTYYVRKTGSDGAAGTSAGAAWLTIGKALLAGGIASGDTVYVGAGIYREALTIGITPVATTNVIGDVDGSQTGDAGEVRWTAYTTDDKTAPGANALNLNGKNFLSFSNIHFVGGSAQGNCVLGSVGSHDLTFTRCAFTHGSSVGSAVQEVPVSLVTTVDIAANLTFDSCWFGPSNAVNQGLLLQPPTSAIADYNLNVVVKNCVFFALGNNGGGLALLPSGAAAFKPGGLSVTNCTFHNGYVGARANASAAIPVLVSNCLIIIDGGNAINATSVGQLIEDYNVLVTTGPRVNASVGPYSISTGNYSQLYSYGQEVIWGGQLRPFGTPLAGSPLLGFGNAALAAGGLTTPTDDATVGTIAWATPGNAGAPEGANLAVSSTIPITTGVSHYLNAQGFGFAIPAGSTIKSIRVELLVKASAATAIACSSVKLLKAGVITGNDLFASNATQFTTSLAAQSWGNTTDPLWGTTWSVAEVNAAGFGCVWAAKNTSAGTQDCSVDFIRVIVAYTLSDGSGGVAVDILGRPRPAGAASTLYAVGALERHDTGVRELTTTDGGSGSSLKQTGPSDSEFQIPVDGSTVTTLSIKFQTLNYVGANYPQIVLLGSPELGVATQTVVASGTSIGAFTTLTLAAITPTAKGIVTIRLQNLTGDGAGIVYWDSLGIS